MAKYIGMSPAYGRDYKSKGEVLEAVKANKDFVITDMGQNDGQVANRESFSEEVPVCLKIRYKKLTQIVVIELKADGTCDFLKVSR